MDNGAISEDKKINYESVEPVEEPNSRAETTKLLRDNLACSQEILDKIKDIKKYIFWQQTWGVIRLLIILVPVVLGFIYLPPLIRNSIEQYRNLFG